nr:hypothetical protein [Tanacetum cinerariifolium]
MSISSDSDGTSWGIPLMNADEFSKMDPYEEVSQQGHAHPLSPAECLSCGALYTGDFCCSKGNVEDKILVPKLPKNYARCARCGHPEDLVTYLKYFQDTFDSSDDSTNFVNAPREPVVVKQDHGVKSSQNPPHIDECCCECGNALDGIFCQQCICKSCGKGAHTGYNCPPKVPIISNQELVVEIKDALGTKKYKPEDLQELFRKLSNDVQNINEELAEYINTPGWNFPAFYDNDDDDDVYYIIAITPVLSTEEPVDSLNMGDEHLDTILTTESDKVIKFSVEDLVPIPSEFEGIPDTIDGDSLYKENTEYVEASPHDFEVVSLEVAEIVITKVEEIKDDNIREKLLNVVEL